LDNLCTGSYNVTVSGTNCQFITNAVVSEPDSFFLVINATDASCNGFCDGSASVTVFGGTMPYTYLWSTGTSDATATNLCLGFYDVTVTDSNNCQTFAIVGVSQPDTISISTSSVDESSVGAGDGSTTATVSGGTSPYTYLWDDPSDQTTATASNLTTGTYNVLVTDFNSCTEFASATVSSSVSVQDKDENTLISIYPNPSSDIISIVSYLIEGYLMIYDFTGRKVMEQYIYHGNNQLEISDLVIGMYIYSVVDINDNLMKHGKIMVE